MPSRDIHDSCMSTCILPIDDNNNNGTASGWIDVAAYTTSYCSEGYKIAEASGGYVFYKYKRIDPIPLPISGLRVKKIRSNLVRIEWDCGNTSGQFFNIYRLKDGTSTLLNPNSYCQTNHYEDTNPVLDGPCEYAVQWVKGHDSSVPPGLTDIEQLLPEDRVGICALGSHEWDYTSCAASAPYQVISVVPVKVVVSENQTVDSRRDMRRDEDKPLDFQFKSRTYKGGLFAGHAPVNYSPSHDNNPDYSGEGQSFLKFDIPHLDDLDDLWGDACLNVYHTAKLTGGTGTHVYCQNVTDWGDTDTLKWSTKPTIDISANSNYTQKYNYEELSDGDPYTTIVSSVGWCSCGVFPEVRTALKLPDTKPLPFGMTTTSTATNDWRYFAKKEYDSSKAPTILYALGGSLKISSITLNNASSVTVTPGATVTGVVYLNRNAPSCGAKVGLWSSNSSVAPITGTNVSAGFINIPANSDHNTFQITVPSSIQESCQAYIYGYYGCGKDDAVKSAILNVAPSP